MEKKLIEAVRSRTILYDPGHEDYLRTKMKAEKWDEVARETDIASGAEAKVKWEKLRHSFRDAVRRQQKCIRNGLPTKQWKFQTQMRFLQPYMANRPPLDDEDSDHKPIYEEDSVQAPPAKKKKKNASSNGHPKQPTEEDTSERLESNGSPRNPPSEPSSSSESMYHFFMSMFEATKNMPPLSQFLVRNDIFRVVTEMEGTLLNIPTENLMSGNSQKTPYYDMMQYTNHAAAQSYSSLSTPDHSSHSNSVVCE